MADEKLDQDVLDSITPFSGEVDPVGNGSMAGDFLGQGKSLQQVKTPYTTAVAVQRPRSITTVVKNVIQEAQLAGASFFYRWQVKTKKGKKTIQGGSIDAAMCIARNYGNTAVDIDYEETPTHFVFKASFIDLETGLTIPRLFRQRKSQAMGMEDADRQEDIVFQIGQSKAQRNAVLRGVPGWLIEKAIQVANDAEIKGIEVEGIAVARAKVVDYFEQLGATDEMLEAYIGRKVDQFNEKDIADLRGVATAIKEGRSTIIEIFGKGEPAPATSGKQEGKKDEKKRGRKKLDETDEYLELQKMMREYPDQYIEITGGTFPKTKKGIVQVIEAIKKLVKEPPPFPPSELEGGRGKGESENSSPGDSQQGQDEENQETEAQKGEQMSFDDVIASDEWQEMSFLKDKYPQYYHRIMKGETPKTMAKVLEVIDGINEMEKAKKGEGIPDA